MIEAVKNSPNAIGYASLSAVEGKEGIKALTVNGVACSEETVLDGSYEIQRPFVLVTKSDASLATAAQAFFDYATSKDVYKRQDDGTLYGLSHGRSPSHVPWDLRRRPAL